MRVHESSGLAMRVASAWLVLTVVSDCGSEEPRPPVDSGTLDAGADGGDVVEPTAPAPPASVETPRLAPCPAGWRVAPDSVEADLVACDPWPGASGPQDCDRDEAHFPGAAGCVRLGSSCPAGDFADDIPAKATVVHVLAGAAAGGDGSAGAPFATIAEAVATASDGAIVAVSKGEFDEAVVIDRPITVWGACVAQTRVASSVSDEDAATLHLTGEGGAIVRNLTLGGERRALLVEGTAVEVGLEDALVENARRQGVFVDVGGILRVDHVAIRSTRTSGGVRGYGIALAAGRATMSFVSVEASHTIGIVATGADTTLVASDVAIRGTLSDDAQTGGYGLQATGGAHVVLERTAIEGSRTEGVLAGQPGTTLDATDLVVRDTEGQELDGEFGFGIEILDGATAEIRRASIDRNRASGVVVGRTSSAFLEDVLVRDTQEETSSGDLGFGLEIIDVGVVDALRVAVVRSRTVGVLVEGAGASLDATDLLVRETRGRAIDSTYGVGIQVEEGAECDLLRAEIARNRGVGIGVAAGSRLGGMDLAVIESRSQESDGVAGRGIEVSGATDIARAWFSGNREVSVFAVGPAATLTLEDVEIEGTAQAECADAGCEAPGGSGLVAVGGASLTATRFAIRDNELCGVQVAYDAELDLVDGEVARNLVGANVQIEAFDISRLQDRVLFRDNGRNLDSAALPVPAGFAVP